MKKNECCILIMSRDASIRQAYLTSVFLEKYWSDCPYDICLCTQTMEPEVNKYNKVIYTNKEAIWGERLEMALKQIDSEFVLLCPEDDFLQNRVDNKEFAECIEFARENNVGAIRMCPPLMFSKKYNEKFDLVPIDSIYRVVLHPMLFKTDYLRRIAGEHYSPWQFERQGSLQTREYEEKIFCVKNPVYNTVHAWSTGTWTREGYKLLLKEKIDRNLYDFAKVYPWYKSLKDYFSMFIIRIAPEFVTRMRIRQCEKDEKKLRL